MKVTHLDIKGMHCVGCSSAVEKALNQMDNVESAVVNLTLEKATVAGEVDPTTLIDAVKNAGYDAEVLEEEATIKSGEKKTEELETQYAVAKKQMTIAWWLTIPVMIWMIPEMVFGVMWPSALIFHAGMVVLSGVVLFGVGRDTLKSAWKSARHRTPNMDVLIALGSLSAWGTGLVKLLAFTGVVPHMASFAGIAGMIVAFHLTGRYIESKARGKASAAIRKLMTLGAKNAIVLTSDGTEKQISIQELRVGDIMVVRASEKIPTDGEIVRGNASVNESLATGESMPVEKSTGDHVLGATINLDSTLQIKATKIGKETFLAQVIKLVESAQTTKVPIQVFADRMTARFVPVVLVLALLTFFVWIFFPNTFVGVATIFGKWLPWVNVSLSPWALAFYAAIAVLVIACPCALGLATPTALMVGSGKGAENGILIRDGAAIQRMNDVTTVVLDKTGTLTKGEPEVAEILRLGDITEAEILRLAASLEKESTHPLAKAIVEKANVSKTESVKANDIRVKAGKGVSGTVDGKSIKIGTADFTGMDEQEFNEKTPVYMSVDGKPVAIFLLTDAIKHGVSDVIHSLKSKGLKILLVTGDREKTAKSMADMLGIDDYRFQVLPGEKAEIVKELQTSGEVVAMVGDGINDAPALAQADVGIALSTGTDIAMESGEIILTGSDLQGVVKSFNLSRAVFKKIKQNLFWAFFYNIIAIPMAVMGLLHPVIAEAAMALSSINVVGNSNRLKKISLR